MKAFLGLDTSNYTTSAAVFRPESSTLHHSKRLLPVKDGELGLRQSDALFHHVRQLPQVLSQAAEGLSREETEAVCVSDKPRNASGSYMPCFLAGCMAADSLGAVLKVPVYRISHQEGHLAAALWSAGRMDLLEQEFIAFHVSGGTFEALAVRPGQEHVFEADILARTLDISAGQLIDRVGQMLGTGFPAGPALERLAAKGKVLWRRKPVLKEGCCCLSGLENLAQKSLKEGVPPEDLSRTILEHIAQVLEAMTDFAREKAGDLPLVYSGGVMANAFLKERLSARGDCAFAQPDLSSDNACGAAILGWVLHQRREERSI